jgi:predicted kinase
MKLVEVDRKHAPLAFLVTGVPGVGKTTVSRELAQRFPRAAHIAADVLGAMVLSGHVPPRAPSGEHALPGTEEGGEGDRQLLLRARNASRLCDSFFRAGFTPIVDDVVVRKLQLDHYLRHVRARPLVPVILTAPREIVIAREPQRAAHKRGLVAEWLFLEDTLRGELADVGLWIDTSAQTPSQSADAILEAVRTGRRGLPADRVCW